MPPSFFVRASARRPVSHYFLYSLFCTIIVVHAKSSWLLLANFDPYMGPRTPLDGRVAAGRQIRQLRRAVTFRFYSTFALPQSITFDLIQQDWLLSLSLLYCSRCSITIAMLRIPCGVILSLADLLLTILMAESLVTNDGSVVLTAILWLKQCLVPIFFCSNCILQIVLEIPTLRNMIFLCSTCFHSGRSKSPLDFLPLFLPTNH